MADMTPLRVAAHPSIETIAAFAEGLLSPPERDALRDHVADCEDCYELMTAALEGIAAVPPPPVLVKRSRRWMLVGAPLAAAAALLLVVRVQPVWWQSLWGPTADQRIVALVEAVGEERLIEGRLTGGFRYGPLRSPTRGGSGSDVPVPLLAAAASADEAAESHPTVANLHARGVARVLLGRYDEGIATLETVVAKNGGNARYHADLAAAYVAAARAMSRDEDWSKALAAADRALALDPGLREAAFNRSLALEALGRTDEARSIWRDLASSDVLGWKEEAARHLQSRSRR